MKFTFPLFITVPMLATSVHGITLYDDFHSNTLNTDIWTPPSITEGVAILNSLNEHLEFAAPGKDGLVNSNHFGSLYSYGLLNNSQDWTLAVSTHLLPFMNFGTFATNEWVSLIMGLSNDTEVVELAWNIGNNGSDIKQITYLDPAGSTASGDLNPATQADLGFAFDSATQTLTATYDMGGGPITIGTTDLSSWAGGTYNFYLTGGAYSSAGTIQSGTFDVTPGDAYFDNLTLCITPIPEPSAAALAGLAGLALLARRRRSA